MKLPYRTSKNAAAVSKIWGKPLEKPDWWRVEASTDEAEEILIYDYIGWPFNDPYDLSNHLAGLAGKDVKVRINSPGGDVFDGLAIYNSLQNYKGTVTTVVDGLAASMASVIAVGGHQVQSRKNAMLMIHEPWTVMAGDQHELRAVADLLQKISGNLLDIYSDRVDGKKRDLKQKMKDETWFTAKEAADYGLIDKVLDTQASKAAFDLSVFSNAPDGISAEKPGGELTEREIERALRDAGGSRSFARAFIAKNYKPLRDAEINSELQNLINSMKGK